eukprot:GHVT01002749.1.p1 GENE.GHVT01002749.1~~GHVT01002749.1.p1  ORF type:complete len:143 (-),score=28.06 GHVT01002749.1:633-1061(-)
MVPQFHLAWPVSLFALVCRRLREAVGRLKRFKEEYELRARRQEIYQAGEDLFGLAHQRYVELEKTKEEISYLTLLYDLYVQVAPTATRLHLDARKTTPLEKEKGREGKGKKWKGKGKKRKINEKSKGTKKQSKTRKKKKRQV